MVPGAMLAIVLTVWNYSSKPLWRDEFYTLDTARRSLPQMVALLRDNTDIGLTGYYGAMHFWLLISTSVWWVRLPGAIATVVVAGTVALLGRRAGGTAVGVVAGLLAATLPAVVIHAQEARPYPLVLAAVSLTVLTMLRYRERPGPGRAWTLALVAAVPGCLHPIVGLPVVVGVFAAALLSPGRASRGGVVLTSLLAAVGGGGLVLLGARVAARQAANPRQGVRQLLDLAPSLVGAWWLTVLLWLAAVMGLVVLRRRSPRPGGASAWPVLLGAVAAPFVVVCGMGLTGSFFQLRYVSAATIPLAVLAAVGLVRAASSLPGRAWVAGLVTISVVVVTLLLIPAASLRRAAFYVDDPQAATLSLAHQLRQGDVVVFEGGTARGLTAMYLPPGSRLDDALLAETPQASSTVSGVDVPQDTQIGVVRPAARLWLVGTMKMAGGWSDPARAERLTVGRSVAVRENYGRWYIEAWDLDL